MLVSLTCCIARSWPGDVGVHVGREQVDGTNSRKEEDNLGNGSAHQENDEARVEEEVSDDEGVCSFNDSIYLKGR